VLRLLAGLLVWSLLCPAGFASAANTLPYPDLRFIRHDGPDGPFRQSFSRLHVDRDGFLWGATLDSVFRFDGHQFQQWPVQGGTSAAFSEDAAGRLWVMTEQELWRFDRERVVRERIALPMLRQNWGIELAHGPHGPWLVTSDGQLFRYSAGDGQFKVYWQPASKKPVLDARSTSRGVLWWVTDAALWRFSPEEDRNPRVVKHFSSVPRLHTTPLVIESPQGEKACISSRTGIECVREDGSTWLSHRSVPPCTAIQVDARQQLHALCGDTVWSQPSGQTGRLDASIKLPHTAREGINEIQVDANGRLWFSLGDAFGIYDLETRSYQSIPVGMEDEAGRTLPAPVFATNRMLASGGNIWFALNGKGLYRTSLLPLPFEHWTPPTDSGAANSPLLRALYEDRSAQGRQLWLADARSSIWRIPLDEKGNLKPGIPVSVTSPLSISECRALVRGPEGVMLYATADRLFAYNAQADAFNPVTVQWPSSAPAMRPCGLHRDMNDQLWMYGSHGIAQLRPDGAGGYRAEVHASQPNSAWDLFDGLYEGSDGWWWIPARNGIRRFNPEQRRWHILTRSNAPLAAEWIHQVVEQPTGVYWLATRGGGLQRIDLRTGNLSDRRRWSEVEPPPESQSPIRYSILPDVKGNLWLAGGRGLDRYDPRRDHWLHFDTSSGLQQLEFNHGAAARLSDGRLVFVGLNGLTVVRPELIDDQRPPPLPRWRGVQVEGGPLRNSGDLISLAYDKRALTVHYLALDYDSPGGIRYRYRLHRDSAWIDVGDQRQLHFAELASGEYRLELQAAYNNGDWPARAIGLQIHIASPWYGRWTTWLSLGLSLSAIAAGYVVARNRRQRVLEAEISEKTKELRVAAEELSSSYARLSESNSALQRSHDEIREKKGRLELALGARERLFRQVSHELRNPLTNIVLPLDDMIRRAGNTATGDRLIGMRRNAERLMEMVESLLDKAKAESEVRLERVMNFEGSLQRCRA
jgi:ligand-binding sensor domain-containing protein